MPSSFLHYIIVYGYLAIFLIVFLQEIGVPGVIPNEISLFFFGYLASRGNINLPLVLLTAISAELTGTGLVYMIFYLFGPMLSRFKSRWLPIPNRSIARLKNKIGQGVWGIFIGRVTPFMRGYTSVLAGLLQIRPKKYFLIAIGSAVCSTGGLVMGGWFLGPYWKYVSDKIPNVWIIIVIAIVIFIVIRLIFFSDKLITKKNIEHHLNNHA